MTDREIAEMVCTPKELEAFVLAYRGMSDRSIALALDLSRSTVKDRLERARRKIHRARRDQAA